ncbi:MAG: energy transducer TonB [Bacteroidia bacterium]|nr:energy transducer TonB [Bacteroidia bacterium]
MLIPDFDDIIFERLNKEYGAYLLRKRYNRVVIVSVVAATILGCAAVLIPYFIIPEQKSNEIYPSIYVTMENLSVPDEQTGALLPPASSVPPQVKAPVRLVAPEVKYIAPEVVDSILPLEKELVSSADSLSGAIPGEGITNGSGEETGSFSGVGGGGGEGNGSGGNGLYSVVEVMPTFKGGDINKFREWVRKKTKYPEIATINGIQGKVYVTFIVEKDGSVTNVKVVKGVDPLINDEALKAVKSSPKWSPGKQRGVAVRVFYMIMLNFQL